MRHGRTGRQVLPNATFRFPSHGTPHGCFDFIKTMCWDACRFGAHRGEYMFHCHMLVHEGRWVVHEGGWARSGW